MLLQGLKPRIFNRLNKFGTCWATGYTPFIMVYGSKAVLPTDLDFGAPRIRAYDEQGAKASHKDAMDRLDETSNVALLHSAKYQQALRWYHS